MHHLKEQQLRTEIIDYYVPLPVLGGKPVGSAPKVLPVLVQPPHKVWVAEAGDGPTRGGVRAAAAAAAGGERPHVRLTTTLPSASKRISSRLCRAS